MDIIFLILEVLISINFAKWLKCVIIGRTLKLGRLQGACLGAITHFTWHVSTSG